jgi:hypothetical protein
VGNSFLSSASPNGLSGRVKENSDSTLQAVRNIPHLALTPLAILLFGNHENAKIWGVDQEKRFAQVDGHFATLFYKITRLIS